jgi:peptidyl-Asp metalloendopeptidase
LWQGQRKKEKQILLHSSGLIWRYTGVPCSGGSCPGWELLDNNPATVAIAVDGSGNLYQLHSSGLIWRYTGVPLELGGDRLN